MTRKGHCGTGAGRRARGFAPLALMLAVVTALSLSPRPAQAQFFCEWPIVPPIVTLALVGINDLALDAGLSPGGSLGTVLNESTKAVMGYVAGDVGIGAAIGAGAGGGLQIPYITSGTPSLSDVPGIGTILDHLSNGLSAYLHSKFYGGLGFMDDIMRYRLDKFWNDFYEDLRAMSRQIYGSGLNTARMLASISDSGGMSMNSLMRQKAEVNEKKQHVVSDQSCQFDTTAQNLNAARAVSTGVKVAIAQQFNEISNNSVGSIGAAGPAAFAGARFALYKNKFCDPNGNAGKTPCPPGASLPNAASAPNVTIFGGDTIDMQTNPDTRLAVNELITNLTNYSPPPVVPKQVLGSTHGQQQFQENRAYSAQMDAIGALVWDVIGDRMPAANPSNLTTGQNIQQARLKQGVSGASATPSEHETLQSVIDQLGDPNYYTDLGDSGGTIGQKEVYLKAYNNMLLYKLVERQERLATAYAIETANMLKKYKDVHRSEYIDMPSQ